MTNMVVRRLQEIIDRESRKLECLKRIRVAFSDAPELALWLLEQMQWWKPR